MKKRNFKVNIIDILVLVLVIVAIIGAFVKFGGDTGVANTNDSVIEYKVQIKEVRQATVDALNKMGKVFDDKNKKEIGEIVNVEPSEAKRVEEKVDGTRVEATVPERFDCLVTIQTQGKVNDLGYYNSINTELRMGSENVIYSQNVKCSGDIYEIRLVQ